MSHIVREAGGLFAHFHEELMGDAVDYSRINPADYPPALIERAQQVWLQRTQTEFRSTQIMTRFLTEVLGAGDPIDIYSGAIDLVADEIRHTALCAGMCRALGLEPRFPSPVTLDDPKPYLEAPMGERAMATAITMVAISESLSFGFISDLRARCEQPVVSAVLGATVDDEEGHQDFGWVYIEKSLKRFPASTMSSWRHLVEVTLEPHFRVAKPLLAQMSPEKRNLAAWPEPELVELGLFSPERQALVFDKTYREVVEPKLRKLNLL
ncbi:MAG: hypothetical protein H0U74_10140 [Bradymonadaceae bacterium]|nr:hypothetical protein [Lujinxingiaceae bacterium]